ncbi:PrkA family serine protein kinase [Micavibrio aeruginosavorus]|uniref:PrkA family serine protein kinase n=1 Tax=Micavibrio aeruginosavorus TaxID=349221 RepID=UPI000674C534|nr:PrkA family serine protein kinase [Micavibrio aeruginosavorus]
MSSNESIGILGQLQDDYVNKQQDAPISLSEYLDLCKQDKWAYANAHERLLKAIGEPTKLDTSSDPKLSRIFSNRVLNVYPAFSDFYGMEDTISEITKFLKAAAQGLEESKQILYLLGPVGSAKSSLAERLKELMEQEPFYTLAVEVDELDEAGEKTGKKVLEYSPVNEDPLGLFDPSQRVGGRTVSDIMEETYGIERRYMKGIMSPWAVQKLKEFDGDRSKFLVVKRWPSKLDQVGISKTEPADENTQDISALVGKTDVRKLEMYSQKDQRSFAYSGGLCTGNRGIMEFVEMFKAPIKTLHPLLTATQEGNFSSPENIGMIPFNGIILAHSNESEWTKFRNNKENEAFLARTYLVRVPYTLRVDEELKIYQKLLKNSALAKAPVAPGTLEMLAEWSVMTRLKETAHSTVYSKMRVYNGENLKDTDKKAKPYTDYRDEAGIEEGMDGSDTRWAFKTLSKVFNEASDEVSADPIRLMNVLEDRIKKEQLAGEVAAHRINLIKEYLLPKYVEFVGKEISTAYVESYKDFGQNKFDQYVLYADHWIQDQDYRDPETNLTLTRADLEEELQKFEKPAGIMNGKDFRNEVVNYVLRARANNGGKNPAWTSYKPLANVIEKGMFTTMEEILPVISYTAKADKKAQERHEEFVKRMDEKGYTPAQTRVLTEWYSRVRKNKPTMG